MMAALISQVSYNQKERSQEKKVNIISSSRGLGFPPAQLHGTVNDLNALHGELYLNRDINRCLLCAIAVLGIQQLSKDPCSKLGWQ